MNDEANYNYKELKKEFQLLSKQIESLQKSQALLMNKLEQTSAPKPAPVVPVQNEAKTDKKPITTPQKAPDTSRPKVGVHSLTATPKQAQNDTPKNPPPENDSIKFSKIKPKDPPKTIETRIGITCFSIIGIIALVIGVVFFIRNTFSFEFTPLKQIAVALSFALAIIGFGQWLIFNNHFKNLARTLIGGGIAMTYFVVYATYSIEKYQLATGISQNVDNLILGGVVLCAVIIALKNNSRIIVAEAFGLGYLTTIIGKGDLAVPIYYNIILTLGLAAIVSWKKWPKVGLLGIFCAYLCYYLPYLTNLINLTNLSPVATLDYINLYFWNSTLILSGFFIIFSAQSLILAKQDSKYNVVTTVINSLFFLLYFFIIDSAYPSLSTTFFLILATFNMLYYYIAQAIKNNASKSIYLFQALLLVTLTMLLEINSEFIGLMFALEFLLLVAINSKENNSVIKLMAVLISFPLFIKTIFIDQNIFITPKIDTVHIVSTITVILVFFITSYLFGCKKALKSAFNSFLSNVYLVFAVLLLLCATISNSYALNDIYASYDWHTISSILLLFYVLIFLLLSQKLRNFYIFAILTATILFVRYMGYPASPMDACHNSYFLPSVFQALNYNLFIILLPICAFYIIYAALNVRERYLPKSKTATTPLYSLFATFLLIKFTSFKFDDELFIAVLILSAVAIIMRLCKSTKRKVLNYQCILLSMFIALYYLISMGERYYLSTQIIVIVTFYMLATIGIIQSLYAQRHQIFAMLYSTLASLLAFSFLFTELNSYWISIGWSCLALGIMASGIFARIRYLRLQGLIIFIITIFKVFLYDTKSLDPTYRSLSYIILGIILIGVAFLYTQNKDKLKKII